MGIKDLKNKESKKPPVTDAVKIPKEAGQKVGRKPLKPTEKRSEQVCLYLTLSELGKLQLDAEKEGIEKVNQYLMQQLRKNNII